jgi:hypothetical protein
MTAGIRVRGVAGADVVYHFALHGGKATVADRVFVEYDWSTDGANGLLMRNGTLQTINPRALQVARSAHGTTITAPWPLTGTPDTFIMARAWTTMAHRDAFIDQSAETVLTGVSD